MKMSAEERAARMRLADLIRFHMDRPTDYSKVKEFVGGWGPLEIASALGWSRKSPETNFKRWRSRTNPKTPLPIDFASLLRLWFGDDPEGDALRERSELEEAYAAARSFSKPGKKTFVQTTGVVRLDQRRLLSPGIYLTTFDIGGIEALEAFIARSRDWYLWRMVAYGALFEFVAFQWSALTKNPVAHEAALLLRDCFSDDDDDVSGGAVFRMHAATSSFSGNIAERMERFANGPLPLEGLAYKAAMAPIAARKLDQSRIKLYQTKMSASNEIAGRVARFIEQLPIEASKKTRLLEHATPATYQTHLLLKAAKQLLPRDQAALMAVMAYRFRREYNFGNAICADAICDFEMIAPFNRWETIEQIACALGIDQLMKHCLNKKKSSLGEVLLQTRTNEHFLQIVDSISGCTDIAAVDTMCGRLFPLLHLHALREYSHWQKMWSTMAGQI